MEDKYEQVNIHHVELDGDLTELRVAANSLEKAINNLPSPGESAHSTEDEQVRASGKDLIAKVRALTDRISPHRYRKPKHVHKEVKPAGILPEKPADPMPKQQPFRTPPAKSK